MSFNTKARTSERVLAARNGVSAVADRAACDSTTVGIPELKAAEFEEIRRFAKQRFGLDLRHGKENLVSARLARGMRQGHFRSFGAYLDFVQRDESGDALVALINSLTTN